MNREKSLEQKRKNQLFRAATACFSKDGYQGTTMENIAGQANLSKGTLYYYFDSKQELFLELLKWWFGSLEEKWDKIIKEGSPREKLEKIHEALVKQIGESEPLGQLMLEYWANAGREKEIETLMNEWLSRYRSVISNIIEEGIEAGQFKKVDPNLTSFAFLATYDGLWFHWIVASGSFSLKETGDQFFENFMNGLKKKNGR